MRWLSCHGGVDCAVGAWMICFHGRHFWGMCCGKIGHSFTGLKRRKASNTPTQRPILYRSGFEPMKESILAPDKPGYWFDKTVGRLQSQRFQHCLHALCILCSMHDETAATRRPAAPRLFLSSYWDSCSCSGGKTLYHFTCQVVCKLCLRCLWGYSHCSDVFCLCAWASVMLRDFCPCKLFINNNVPQRFPRFRMWRVPLLMGFLSERLC